MVFIILLGAAMLTSGFRAFGGEELVRDFLQDLPGGFWTQFVVVMIVIFLLGFFLDFIEIAVVVVPIIAPILLAETGANVTAVWLGVMIGVNLQTSFLTPPFGFALFYLKGVAPKIVQTLDIWKGVVPFIALQLVGLAIVGSYPTLVNYLPNILSASRIYITACGTSWHAGLIGKHLIEEYARVPVHVEYASEFRYRNAIIDANTIVIAISQSGETADTLAALKKAKELGAITLGICNVVGSAISRETDGGIFTHAGPEIGVASTKAFTSQVTVLIMFALNIGRKKGVSKHRGKELISALKTIDQDVASVLRQIRNIKEVAKHTASADNYLYLGRGINFPVALEGALKLKEISYIHAEGYPAAEMKHGPIALIDENMPVVFIAPYDDTFNKVLSNIEEVKARGGIVISITDKINNSLKKLSDFVLIAPQTHKYVFPITCSIILQMLAYELAVCRKCEIDQPRNLAKSVTVE